MLETSYLLISADSFLRCDCGDLDLDSYTH